MIVVFGATGTIGSQVLHHLREAGAPVRVAVRSADKAEQLSGVGVEAMVADLADPATLPAALDGAERVFLVTPASPEQVELEGNLVDALAGTGVHLVKLAALGYDKVPVDDAITLAANHARIVGRARDAGLALTVLAPTGFSSNLLASAGTARVTGQLYASSGDGGVSWVDPSDVGAVAAHVLTSPGHEGASYDVTGPEVLTQTQVAELLSEALGRDVTYVDVPPEHFPGALQQAGLPEWLAHALTELNQVYRAHQAEVVTGEVEKATGRPARTVREFLGAHLEHPR